MKRRDPMTVREVRREREQHQIWITKANDEKLLYDLDHEIEELETSLNEVSSQLKQASLKKEKKWFNILSLRLYCYIY